MAASLDLDDLFRGFSQRERDFCLHYVGAANFVATKAAELAGYANPLSEGSRIRKREHIVDAIARLMAQRNEDLSVDAKWVLVELVEVQRAAKAAGHRGDNLKALDLIGRHVDVRAFREQHGLSGPNGEPLNPDLPLDTLTEEELDALERISRKLYGRAAGASALPSPAAFDDRGGAGAPPEGGGA